MKALFNPFRYIAGAKTLTMGLLFIVASSLMLYSGNLIQDSYIHIAMAKASFWEVLGAQTIWWIIPTALLYLCGLLLSKSKIRISSKGDIRRRTNYYCNAGVSPLPLALPCRKAWNRGLWSQRVSPRLRFAGLSGFPRITCTC